MLAIEENLKSDTPRELVIASIHLTDEHEDNARFLKECEGWFGQKVLILTCEKYNSSVDNVIASTRYMSGPYGARCTKELKKQVRLDWQQPDDIHVFGMDCDEQNRIDDLIDSENDLDVWPILIEKNIPKKECFAMLEAQGIQLPMMYILGYNNNNCIGCLKAQSPGYWNKIRADFPQVFQKRLVQELRLGVALCRISANRFINEYPDHFQRMMGDKRNGLCTIKINSKGAIMIPLRYMPEDLGTHEPIYVPDCGFICEKN